MTLVVLFTMPKATIAQNADEIIFNQYAAQNSFAGGSFVIDTGVSLNQNQKRAFLIWAANVKQDTLKRYLTLSEYGVSGQYLTEKGMPNHKKASLKTLFPKKIIKSKFSHAYYLLGYVTNSNHPINSLTTYSLPVVYKINGATLNPVWVSRIHFSPLSPNLVNAVIEYNDIIETNDGNVVLVGKYATSTTAKEYVLSTKLSGAAGNMLWRYYYFFGNTCSEGANSIAETTDGNLSVVGYVKRCTTGLTGPYDMFYTQLTAAGITVPGTYNKFLWTGTLNLWGDKITRYTNIAGSDNLVISGYVDIKRPTTVNRQILITNIKQSGALISMQHIGDTLSDVANDLIVEPVAGTASYNMFVTGATSNYNSTSAVKSEAYYMSLKLSAATGVTGVTEFSTFPVTAVPYNTYTGRTGLEIKNASFYKRFAILATGNYKPTAASTQTYTDVLIRDLSDASGACIKTYQPPVKSFATHISQANPDFTKPDLDVYKDDWITLGKLTVKQLCQQVKIDPTQANFAGNQDAFTGMTKEKVQLLVQPNPVRSVLMLSTVNGSALATDQKAAYVKIYSMDMQLMQTMQLTLADKNSIQVPVQQLHPGTYFLQLQQGGEVRSLKFIKE